MHKLHLRGTVRSSNCQAAIAFFSIIILASTIIYLLLQIWLLSSRRCWHSWCVQIICMVIFPASNFCLIDSSSVEISKFRLKFQFLKYWSMNNIEDNVGEIYILKEKNITEIEWHVDRYYVESDKRYIRSEIFIWDSIEWYFRLHMENMDNSHESNYQNFRVYFHPVENINARKYTAQLGMKRNDGYLDRLRKQYVCFYENDRDAADYLLAEATLDTAHYLNEYGIMVFICSISHAVKIKMPFSASHYRDVSTDTTSVDSTKTLTENLKELLVSGRHADVKFKVGCKEFLAHKSILSARSTVLGSMFSHDMLENNSGVVNIRDTDEDTFENLLVFLYTGKIGVNSFNINGLYSIADKYDLEELKGECVKHLMAKMSIDTVCDALRVSMLYGEKELWEMATKFFLDHAQMIFDTPKWLSFLKDHLEIGNELIQKSFEVRPTCCCSAYD